ncbi:hypothetical protein BKA70DRAFT_1218204 [Coprinopsis sp. MPI-PUGE-AT-0042]|nr:hypothetical protein BKA70DRAFT_1218204 [Coprinopsis sp. MPI-PUGE-AT-0042]
MDMFWVIAHSTRPGLQAPNKPGLKSLQELNSPPRPIPRKLLYLRSQAPKGRHEDCGNIRQSSRVLLTTELCLEWEWTQSCLLMEAFLLQKTLEVISPLLNAVTLETDFMFPASIEEAACSEEVEVCCLPKKKKVHIKKYLIVHHHVLNNPAETYTMLNLEEKGSSTTKLADQAIQKTDWKFILVFEAPLFASLSIPLLTMVPLTVLVLVPFCYGSSMQAHKG